MTRALSAATVDAIAEIAVHLHHRETHQPRRSWKQLEPWERPYLAQERMPAAPSLTARSRRRRR